MKQISNFVRGAQIVKDYSSKVTNEPGVYFMYNIDKTILYIGKAKNLNKRIRSYSKPSNMSLRIQRMVSQIFSIDFITTEHEASALLLEANMIKKHKPKFNILLRDDKSYPYILLRNDHNWQQIIKARGNKVKNKGDYFGPFASVDAVHKTLNAMQRAFPLRTCSDYEIKNRNRPCIQYQIKRCSGPCANLINKDDYSKIVIDAKLFLLGKNNNLQPKLEKSMELASKRFNYEEAAILRDRIRALNFIQKAEGADLRNIKDADVFSITHLRNNIMNKNNIYFAIQVFFYRSGKNFGSRTHYLNYIENDNLNSILGSFIPQFYVSQIPPPSILVSHLPNNNSLIERAFYIKYQRKTKIICPQKGENKTAVTIGLNKAKQAIAKKLSEYNNHTNILKELTKTLYLDKAPIRIEIYDNSHFSGSNMIGVMVVASNTGFIKNQYRKFNIRNDINNFKAGDDYGMMEEVFTRRFNKLREDSKNINFPKPDLIIIDGGKGQVSVACKVLKELNIENITVIGVSKGKQRNAGNEKIHFAPLKAYLPNSNKNINFRNPLILDKNDPILYYIQRLRDEAHRFAISSQRNKQKSLIKKSVLSEIPSIGAKRKKILLMHFSSIKHISEASLNELNKISGISLKSAKEIYNFFQNIKN
ncbi:MAG: excinuclease ABC subunit UvrC [Pelagibacterales bacterium]|nr:excinuclease ABC subunit UvrC [Pelagibacterales bacterium]